MEQIEALNISHTPLFHKTEILFNTTDFLKKLRPCTGTHWSRGSIPKLFTTIERYLGDVVDSVLMKKKSVPYQVMARKYRPQAFGEVVGQEATVTTLQNAIHMERIAHAYLFSGCRGTGKTTLARLFAKALNCANRSKSGEPCNECPSCKEIAIGQAIDVLEIDGASHRGIEDIRQINETVCFAPQVGHYKIYLIDEVHMLTKEAFNALLKTLEEPPSHVKFFFATTEPHKIPPTILSRCQRFQLNRIAPEKISKKLGAIAKDLEIKIEMEALDLIASLADGSLRDAESLLDQITAFQEGQITPEKVEEVLGLPSPKQFFALDKAGSEGDWQAPFAFAAELFSSGRNVSYFFEELLAHFRTLFLLRQGVIPSTPYLEEYRESAKLYRDEQLLAILEAITEGQGQHKFAVSERTFVEMLLLKIFRSHTRPSIEQLVERLARLEQSFAGTEDPHPRPEELPKPPSPPKVPSPKNPPPPAAPKPTPSQTAAIGQKQQSHFDTVMRFAAKELNGSLKTE
ncbi:MAG: DNA polymerase III subunit tau [Chlamydiae bacterium]|nr:DNA polymerase III subunit tau [Chlamydiota bacterium]